MKKIAVIIKHPFRDFDWRIDMYEVPEETSYDSLRHYVMSKMLGPFEIIALTERIDFDCKIKTKPVTLQSDDLHKIK